MQYEVRIVVLLRRLSYAAGGHVISDRPFGERSNARVWTYESVQSGQACRQLYSRNRFRESIHLILLDHFAGHLDP